MEATPSLSQRASSWRRVVAGPARFAANAGLCAAAIGMALVARNGTLLSRSLAVAGCVLAVAVVIGIWLVRGRHTSNARQLVRRVIVPTDPVLGARALRAAGLVEREDGGQAPLSRALAHVHLERVIAGASLQHVERAAARRARRYRVLGFVSFGAVVAVGALALRELMEGFDVLIARGPRAPVPMTWTERLRITAQPPAYLRAPPRRLSSGGAALLPKGTNLTLRARPLIEGRSLVVSDGESESPFVSDGEGGVVAHYTVTRDVSLVIAARFGEVLIVEPEAISLTALGDEAPVVELEGAPATLSLSELRRLELRWTALDDHGLRQIDLVLRSGTREERRLLATYDGESAEQRGAHVLLATDPFLRSLYLPAQISIEAKDNDPVQGAKWGASAAYEIVPTAVGEADAQRYLALARARDRFVDALAAADAVMARPDAAGEAAFDARLDAAVRDFEQAATASYGGLRVAPGLRNLALGRLRVLADQAGSAASRAPALGETILAVDAVLASLSTRDAQRVAKVLAEVAEEAMVGAGQARSLEGSREAGIERLDRAVAALTRGAAQLLLLGNLGNDIGSVALADLGRVQRAREQSDFFHAELAARHLADRLRRPTPSFGAQGSGGVEAGQSGGSAEPSGQTSEAEQRFDQLAWEIAQLVRDHASAVERVDQTLSDAQAAVDHEALRAEAERRAAELRESVLGFPVPGHTPESAEADAALSAEHARAMAHNLESLRLDAAAENGRRAQSALRGALGKAGAGSPLGAELSATDAVVSEQLEWLAAQLAAVEQEARERARGMLQEPAAREQQLAEAADRLASRGENDATPLPREVTERLRQADQLMRLASRALADGDGEQGSRLQREAQRLLETADPGNPHEGEEGDQPSAGEEDGSARPPGFGGEVPDAEDQNKAEEFRRRVLENLGESGSGRLGPAVRRYAEGLLR